MAKKRHELTDRSNNGPLPRGVSFGAPIRYIYGIVPQAENSTFMLTVAKLSLHSPNPKNTPKHL